MEIQDLLFLLVFGLMINFGLWTVFLWSKVWKITLKDPNRDLTLLFALGLSLSGFLNLAYEFLKLLLA